MDEVIISSCKRVYETLGFGLMEVSYEKALKMELRSRGYLSDNEVYVNVEYEDSSGEKHFITSLRIDILIKSPERVVLELKTVQSVLKRISKEYNQVKRYEKLLKVDTSYLINFGLKGLEVYNTSGDSEELDNLVLKIES